MTDQASAPVEQPAQDGSTVRIERITVDTAEYAIRYEVDNVLKLRRGHVTQSSYRQAMLVVLLTVNDEPSSVVR